MILSIIIPVYNVEKYIKRCIDSIKGLNIPESEYEVIFVNDGTKDNSMTVVNENIRRNFRIVNQDNKGLSGARNTGMLCASGDYVWFVDSDDYINPDISDLVKCINETKSDIIVFDYIGLYGNRNEMSKYLKDFPYKITGKEYIRLYSTSSAWRNIYKRSFLNENKLMFIEGHIHEDDAFNMEAFILAESVSYVNLPLYYYDLTRDTSITHIFNSKRVVAYLRNVQIAGDLVDKYKLSNGHVLYKRGGSLFNELLNICKQNRIKANVLLPEIIRYKRPVIKALRKSRNKKYIIESMLFQISPKLFLNFFLNYA